MSRSVSWGWLAATLFGVVVAMTPYALRGFISPANAAPAPTPIETPADMVEIKARVNRLESSGLEHAFAIREIQAAQAREHKLLVQIARKMGIEVAPE